MVRDAHGHSWHCWEGSSCYTFPQEALTKAQADDKCLLLGAHVIALETAKENEAIVNIIKKYGKCLKMDW